MRVANVFWNDVLAGTLRETDVGYQFQYAPDYLMRSGAQPVSLTLPLQGETFEKEILFPFFDGLIPEGWILSLAVNNWKLEYRDRFGLLLQLCGDCIGCVSIKPIQEGGTYA